VPIRRIPMSRRSVTGFLAGGISVESTLERDFALLHLFDPAVSSLEEQPVQIRYRHQGGNLRYTPDFLVQFRDAGRPSELVEVKYEADLQKFSQEYAPRFYAAGDFAARRGWKFTVATEISIRTAKLENVRFLLPRRRDEVEPNIKQRLQLLLTRDPVAVRELIGRVGRNLVEQASALHCLWHMVSLFEVEADLDQPLTMDTLVHRPDGAGG